MIKLVIFDLDGTLIEFHKEYLFSETERIIKDLDAAEVSRDVLESAFADFDYFRFVEPSRRREFSRAFAASFDWDSFPPPALIDGALETLAELSKRGIKSAIVTSRNCSPDQVLDEIKDTGLMRFVEHLISREDSAIHWTDKRANLLAMCDYLGTDPRQALMVGDIPADIDSARQAGLSKAVAVLSGGINRSVLELTNPDAVIPHVGQLLSPFTLGLFE